MNDEWKKTKIGHRGAEGAMHAFFCERHEKPNAGKHSEPRMGRIARMQIGHKHENSEGKIKSGLGQAVGRFGAASSDLRSRNSAISVAKVFLKFVVS